MSWRERAIPYVIVKLWPGKTEQQKTELALPLAKFDLVLLFTVIADMVLKPKCRIGRSSS